MDTTIVLYPVGLPEFIGNWIFNALLIYAGMRYERWRSGRIEYHDDHGPNWDRKEPEL
jgi:hypothetical protein